MKNNRSISLVYEDKGDKVMINMKNEKQENKKLSKGKDTNREKYKEQQRKQHKRSWFLVGF